MTPAAERFPALHAIENDRLSDGYDRDVWRSFELGFGTAGRTETLSFKAIGQPWLRSAAKKSCRQRLAANYAFNTVSASVQAIGRFSAFLGASDPPVEQPGQVDRQVVLDYLVWLGRQSLADSTKALSRSFLRIFLEENRRYGWAPEVKPDAVIYWDEVGYRRSSLPRFVPEFVMSQLESEANLAKLPEHYRNLLVVVMETGLRVGDAIRLRSDAVVGDSAGWPCLRFEARKMRAEQMVPLSWKAVEATTRQKRLVAATWLNGSPFMFPASRDPSLPQGDDAFRHAFASWQKTIGLHDESGRPVHVVPHQLRHSLGTRLINKGVPQHVIQRLLGHASPEMTATYARLHDSTLRAEMERYWAGRVDYEGRLIGFDPEAPTADAEWLKHHLARVADTLPNGYCGRPPKQDCPHPNACLTCPDFQTTVEFLGVHRQQAEATLSLIEQAEDAGRHRLAENHRRVLANLEKIIPALEAQQGDDRPA